MPDKVLYPRFAEPRLTEALADSPIVLIHGPRQCGKTTLARIIRNCAQTLNEFC
jgi:predicted AAA+ superfamily ATPase